jgi:hypothetical protein
MHLRDQPQIFHLFPVENQSGFQLFLYFLDSVQTGFQILNHEFDTDVVFTATRDQYICEFYHGFHEFLL